MNIGHCGNSALTDALRIPCSADPEHTCVAPRADDRHARDPGKDGVGQGHEQTHEQASNYGVRLASR